MVNFVTHLFVIVTLKLSTITTYLAGLQHHLVMNDIPKTVWSKELHQVMSGYQRDEAAISPMVERFKIPFTRHMILSSKTLMSSWLGKDSFWVIAMHAALCMGFMFLFRKSEFLTKSDRKPKVNDNGIIVTLQAEDVELWFNGVGYKATEWMNFPEFPCEMLSMFLRGGKSDQFGKGASRWNIAEPGNPHCMVKVIEQYVRAAKLRKDDCFFAGPLITISSIDLASIMKATCVHLGIDEKKCTLYSIRIGGLVTLFAAGVPDSLKQLAGRWASPTSFIVYARATMAQFSQISSALNDPNLVTSDDIKRFYKHVRK
jgi:hypothetical protein